MLESIKDSKFHNFEDENLSRDRLSFIRGGWYVGQGTVNGSHPDHVSFILSDGRVVITTDTSKVVCRAPAQGEDTDVEGIDIKQYIIGPYTE